MYKHEGVCKRSYRVNTIKGKVGGVPNGTRQCRYADWTKDSRASGDFPVVIGLGHPHG